MKFLEKWNEKLEFQKFCEGLSKGYQYAFSRLKIADGKLKICHHSDAEIGWQYEKHPKKANLLKAWKAGYFYGYASCYADYNSGSLDKPQTSMPELIDDARREFDSEKDIWRNENRK